MLGFLFMWVDSCDYISFIFRRYFIWLSVIGLGLFVIINMLK